MRTSKPRFMRTIVASVSIMLFLGSTAPGRAFAKGGAANTDGAQPVAGLIMDSGGNLYGTTATGGTGNGTVFKLSKSSGGWTNSTLFSFNGNTSGGMPEGSVVMDGSGNLYGTTLGGGSASKGTVFKLAPPTSRRGSWTESVLLNFNGANGANPENNVIMDSSGNIYGMTKAGGTSNDGVVFELTPSGGAWSASVLHSFTGNPDGRNAFRRLFISNGILYGTTLAGGTFDAGTVFDLANSGGGWSESVLYSFEGGTPDGQAPVGLILNGGNFLGTTETGGANGAGTVFELTPNGSGGWNESIPLNFPPPAAGQETLGGVIADNSGNLYGTTNVGGTFGAGTVFELSSAGVYSVLYDFRSTPDGNGPADALTMDSSGNLYGTTMGGGSSARGTVFKLTSSGGTWTESILWSFSGPL